jgi:hypothetical protein
MARRGDLLIRWPEELLSRTYGGPQSGLGPTAVQVVYLPRRGLAISGRQLAHDLLRRVLLPRNHVDAGTSCPQRGPQDSQTA